MKNVGQLLWLLGCCDFTQQQKEEEEKHITITPTIATSDGIRCEMSQTHSELAKALALLGIGMTTFLLIILSFHALCIYLCYCLVPSKDLQSLKKRSKRKTKQKQQQLMKKRSLLTKKAHHVDIEAIGKIVHL